MAVTIITTPKDYAPIYNEMVFTASSTNSGNTNFGYLVDIYINGSVTKAARLRIPPDTNGYCTVDIHRVLEATLTYDLFDITNTAGSVDCDNMSLDYVVKFGEEYGTTVVQYPDLTVDSTRYAINASLGRNEFIDYSDTDYVMGSTTSKFLTNSPSDLYTSINDFGAMYFNGSGTLPSTVTMVTFDSTMSIIASYKANLVGTSDIQYIASNPASINLLTLASGSQPVIDSSVYAYGIYLDTLGSVKSEIKTFYIRESCKNELNRLIFLNRLGGFDSFNFYGASQDMTDVEKKMYKKNPTRIDGSGNYTYSKADREKEQYYTKSSDKRKLVSDWITEEESNWLLELIESPVIYLQEDGELISIAQIKQTNYVKRKHTTDKLFNIEVEIEFGWDNYRQRG